MGLQQWEIQENAMCSVDFICSCNIDDEGDNNDTANIVSSSINVNNIDAESTDTVSSIVRACDTDVSYQNIWWFGFSQNP